MFFVFFATSKTPRQEGWEIMSAKPSTPISKKLMNGQDFSDWQALSVKASAPTTIVAIIGANGSVEVKKRDIVAH